MAKKRRSSKKSKPSRSRSKSRSRSSSQPATNANPLDGYSGLDGDVGDLGSASETTGRTIVVNMNPPGAASMKSMLSSISNTTGLGSRSASICQTSDFDDGLISENDADSAEVVVLEGLGIALLNGDIDQATASASMATDTGGAYVVEQEYMNYALGFRSQVEKISPGVSAANFQNGGVAQSDLVKVLLELVGQMSSSQVTANNLQAQQCFDDTRTATWGLHATEVLNQSFTGDGIKVAVLDTGMDLGHPDFAGRSIAHAVFSTSPGDTTINDINGHGTHCIGTACGSATSSLGPRYGVASGAEIFAGKVLSGVQGSGGDFGILRGIEWALNNECEIISMSLGAPVNQPGFPMSYEQAARRALDQGSLIIAATGNDSRRNFGIVRPVGRPANCPSIVGVGAVDKCLSVAGFSNGRRFTSPTGGEVNLVGPGVNVISSFPRFKGSVASLDGTSMATPHVAGIAAVVAEETGLRGVDLYRELRRRAMSIGNFDDFGHGLSRV